MSEENNSKNIKNNKPPVDLSRRRLAKMGLLASPILATLPGKSALAGNCTTLSGMLSGNLSSPDGVVEPCDNKIQHAYGCSHGYWKTSYITGNDHAFPPGYSKTSFCGDIGAAEGKTFNCPPNLASYTILEILNLTGSEDYVNITRQAIAAYFNAKNSEYFISPGQVIDIYNDLILNNSYIDVATGLAIDTDTFIDIIEGSFVDVGCDRNNIAGSQSEYKVGKKSKGQQRTHFYFLGLNPDDVTGFYRYGILGGYEKRLD